MFILDEMVEFSDQIGVRPIQTVNKFHSQFQLKSDKYRDNNNFIKYNLVTSSNSRTNLVASNEHHSYLNVVLNPVWISERWSETEYITEDGENYFYVNDELIFGAYFFLSDVQVNHKIIRVL
jgi:type II secretory pathway component PulC